MKHISKLFREPNNFLIIGKKGSAKTSLGWHFLDIGRIFQERKLYIYKYPSPELLKTLPFKVENLTTIKQLYNLTDSICLVDEAHRHFDVLNKSVNSELREILANSRQNKCSFIFITHNSYFITRGLFSYIDVRVIKEVTEGHWDVERPHMKKLYSNTMIEGKKWFFMDSDSHQGKEQFDKPKWFTKKLSEVYRNKSTEELTLMEKVRKDAGKKFFQKKCGTLRTSAKKCEKEK